MTTQTTCLDDYEIHYTDHEYYMDFKIYEITGRGENKKTHKYDVPLYGEGFSEVRDDAATFWEGSIKWDGCSNWDFKTNECMAHFCGRKDACSIGRLMEKLYNLASTMAKFDKECAA
jgi:hypothetical protein